MSVARHNNDEATDDKYLAWPSFLNWMAKLEKVRESKNVKRIIVNSQVGKRFKMRMGNYCEARDYLLTSLIFDNASRPGVISNMTLGEYKRATERVIGYVISVTKHKTVHKDPVNIACT